MISLRDVVTGFGNRDPLAEVWRRDLRGGGSAVISGVPPLRYIGDGRPLTDYLISGNTVQDGTPSPDAPVDAVGCGVRTVNLVDESKVTFNTYIDNQGTTGNSNVSNLTDYIDIGALPFVLSGVRTNDIMNSSTRGLCYYDSNKNYISGTIYATDIMTRPVRFSKIPQNAKYVRFAFDKAFENGIMLNLGSSALPYEPYGFKLPLTVNGTEYPIYLGTVPTTRRVKKLVLTGEESWNTDTYLRFSIYVTGIKTSASRTGHSYCSRYECLYHAEPYDNDWNNVYYQSGGTLYFHDRRFATVADWKSYLAAQYAAGTPVTVWYVLAEPETAVVNEPLMKIGDYADTVSFAQAGVTIPTVNGENVLDVPAEVPPSEVTIKGGISSV